MIKKCAVVLSCSCCCCNTLQLGYSNMKGDVALGLVQRAYIFIYRWGGVVKDRIKVIEGDFLKENWDGLKNHLGMGRWGWRILRTTIFTTKYTC